MKRERKDICGLERSSKDGSKAIHCLRVKLNSSMLISDIIPKKSYFNDITLYADHGEKVAFVGATGAGKTTITNLINRFYDIADGTITYDGININRIKKKDLRRSLDIVLQDTNLFTGTIKENIRYGNLDATDEEVYAAAKTCECRRIYKYVA